MAGRAGTSRMAATRSGVWPTEFGKFDGLTTLGGASAENDGHLCQWPNPSVRGQTSGFGQSVVDFLKNRASKLGEPFYLFVSL